MRNKKKIISLFVTSFLLASCQQGANINSSSNLNNNSPNATQYPLALINTDGTGYYEAGKLVEAEAAPTKKGLVFSHWQVSDKNSAVINGNKIVVSMPQGAFNAIAYYKNEKKDSFFNDSEVSGLPEHSEAGLVHTLVADIPRGEKFDKWVGDTETINDVFDPIARMAQPNHGLEIEAATKPLGFAPMASVSLEVRGGTGSGNVQSGQTVKVNAKSRHPSVAFVQWRGDVNQVPGFDVNVAKQEFTMPNRNIFLYATYRQLNLHGHTRALMATDWLQDPDLFNQRHKDMEIWRSKGINTIYSTADLQYNCNNTRPYIVAGRTPTQVKDVVVNNINMLHEQGFNVMVFLTNSWAMSDSRGHVNKFGACLGSTGRQFTKQKDYFSSNQHKENQKAFWRDLYNKVGNKITGVVLHLEPDDVSDGQLKSFEEDLANSIRSTGFNGEVYTNGIGCTAYPGSGQGNIRSAPSINSPGLWKNKDWKYDGCGRQTIMHIRNADGLNWKEANPNSPYSVNDHLAEVTATAHDDGWILWYQDYIGISDGTLGDAARGRLKDWHHTLIRDPKFEGQLAECDEDQSSFHGAPFAVPGIAIQAENFDRGCSGEAYLDTNPQLGNANWRSDTDVDIYDHAGNRRMGSFVEGEWTEYSVNVTQAGKYYINLSIASDESDAQIAFSIDGVDLTGPITVPDTNSWIEFTNFQTKVFDLKAGEQIIRLEGFKNGSQFNHIADIDYFQLFKFDEDEVTDQSPFPAGAHSVPGKIEAENFDNGGNNVSYSDSDIPTGDSLYRGQARVDVYTNKEHSANTLQVGSIRQGEWLEYTVQVQKDAEYEINSQLTADGSGGVLEFFVDGQFKAKLDVPNTNGWRNLQQRTSAKFDLTAGRHVLRVNAAQAGTSGYVGDVDWFELREASVTPPPPKENDYCSDEEWPASRNRSGQPLGGHKKNNLVKGSSDGAGKLVVLLSCEYMGRTGLLGIYDDNNNLIEQGVRKTDYVNPHNDNREDFRFSRSGSSYGFRKLRVQIDGVWYFWRGELGGRTDWADFKPE